jgi:hypothetical protein
VTRPEQDQAERWALEQLFQALRIDAGDPESWEKAEPPDFWVRVPGIGRVGIELTVYNTGPDPDGERANRRAEGEYQRIEELARQLNDERTVPFSAHVHLRFKKYRPPPKKHRRAFVEELLAWIDSAIGSGDPANLESRAPWPKHPLLTEYLKLIEVDAWELGVFVPSCAPKADAVGIRDHELLLSVDRKCDSVRPGGPIQQYWLVVHSGTNVSEFMGLMYLSRVQELTQATARIEAGPFDRVFILNHWDLQVMAWQRGTGWQEAAPPRRVQDDARGRL